MPRDARLYMTFPNDFHRHPKLTRLPVDVRWTFVEMNGEARIADNDGVFDVADAEFMWPLAHLEALVGSHPTRPLVTRDGDQYTIRDYSEHQQTREERDDLHAKRAAAGALGAAARVSKRQASAKQVLSKVEQTYAESESESELEIHDLSKTSKSRSRNKHASDVTDSYTSPTIRRMGNQAGIIDAPALVAEILSWTGRDVSADRLPGLVNHFISKSKTPVRSTQAYMVKCLRESALEVQQYIDQEGLA